MSRFTTILYPTDFSPYADYAQHYAVAFAKQYKAALHCVHVIDTRAVSGGAVEGVYVTSADIEQSLKAIEEHARDRMAHVTRKAAAAGVEVTTHVTKGAPAADIIRVGQEIGANLIVIATHGRSGLDRLILGSTCEKVVRTSPMPVLVVKHPEHDFVDAKSKAIQLNRVLCPCDFSETSREALPIATDLCRDFNATLVFAHAVDTWLDYPEFSPSIELSNSPTLARKAQEMLEELAAGQSGIRTEVRVKTGLPHRVLTDLINEENVDLLVMATHGRSGLSHVLLGSLTAKMVRVSPCPVLTIKPTK